MEKKIEYEKRLKQTKEIIEQNLEKIRIEIYNKQKINFERLSELMLIRKENIKKQQNFNKIKLNKIQSIIIKNNKERENKNKEYFKQQNKINNNVIKIEKEKKNLIKLRAKSQEDLLKK